MNNFLIKILCIFIASAMTGCAVMSTFDQNTYDSATKIKSQALALIPFATEKPDLHTVEIEALKASLSSQLAYELGKGKPNVISYNQWAIIASTDHDLLGKLISDWQAGKTFSSAYLVEKRQQISDAFDQVLKLEGAKIR